MSLKILKAEEPIKVEHINMCLYSPPGIGKTTLSFTASNPLLLDFDNGAYRAANRKDIVQPQSWADVDAIGADDLKGYDTLILDTAGRALDKLTVAIIAENPKLGRGGALTLQGFGALKSKFAGFLKLMNSFGKDVVLLAHMDEQRNGDDIIERLDVQGGSKGEIYKSADAMGRIFIRDKKRVIDFSPRENAFGKNPASLEVLEIPDIAVNPHFLADVISGIKAKLNAESETQKEAHQTVEKWREVIEGLVSAEDFNLLLAEVKKAPKSVQGAFAKAAKAAGLTFDKETGLYVAPIPTETASPSGAELFGK